jgi:ADP-ribosylglycohydrolase
MLGAIAGDVIGSVYEGNPIKTTDFPLFSSASTFTDDTVLTVAVADAILQNTEYVEKFKEYYRLYPHAGYGGTFRSWAASTGTQPYNSWGNGSAMRVSPVGFAYSTLEQVLAEAKHSAEVTHNHPEGIKGAQATACAVFLARTGSSKADIRAYVETTFGYDLSQTLDEIRPTYAFDVSCQGAVPQAITAFLESDSYEDAVRKAISLGGDSDTQAAIAGGIAEACYGSVPEPILQKVWKRLDDRLRQVVQQFYSTYMPGETA